MRLNQRGFTLLELIVVIAIFAIFAVMAYGGLNSVLSTRVQVERAQDRLAALQKTYMKLRDDLQQVAARPTRDGYGDLQPAVRGLDSPVLLDFTRGGWRNPALVARSTLERVSYRVEDGSLIRASFRVLDQAQDSKAQNAVLLEQVGAMKLRYLDADRQWRTRWPPDSADIAAAEQPPPLAVEVTLETRDLGDIVYLFRIGLEATKLSPGYGAPPSGDGDTPPGPVTTPGGDEQ